MAEKKIDFEKELNRLNEMIEKLENDNSNLEDSLKLYEEAKALIKKLQKALKEAEQKVETIISKDE